MLNPFSFNHFQKGRIRKSVLAPLPFGECQKNVPFPENRTLSCQKIVLSRKMYLFQKNVPFPEKCTFSQKNVPFPRKMYLFFVFSRKMYLFSEIRTIAPYPLSHNGFRRFGFQKFVLIFTFLENYLHKYIQRIYILLIFVSETKMVGSSNG